MALLERKRISKWHKNIAATVREVTPSEKALSANITIFPYAQVHAFTKDYLDKRKRSQIERDKALVDLIYGHPRREVAFASCAAALSEPLVEELLSELFPIDTTTLDGLEAYLEAFIAAAHSKNELFLNNDLVFATTMIPIARDIVTGHITPSTAEQLFSTWADGPPYDSLLLSRAKLISKVICRRVSADLADRSSLLWWSLARDYRRPLLLLRRTCADLEDILYSTFPAWRSWASWSPDLPRLQAWISIKSAEPFAHLRDMDGPSLTDHRHGTEWKALLRKGDLLSWLSSRFTLGPGLITDDSEQHLESFMRQLLDIVVVALQRGSLYSGLLRTLINNQGLDWQPLKAWTDLVSIVPTEFLELVVTSCAKDDSDSVLLRGLHSLTVDTAEGCRKALAHQIGIIVNRVAESTQLGFLARFASGNPWLTDAQRLWTLRGAILGAPWLHQYLDERLLRATKSQNPSRTVLPCLSELQQAVVSNSNLEASVEVYVRRFVLDGAVQRDGTTTIVQVLHTLFCCTARAEIRDAGIAVASLTGFDIANRTLCIRLLLSLPTELVQELYECLLLLPSREYANFVKLTGVIKAVRSAPGPITVCFGNLLRWTFEAYEFRLNCSGFTSSGFKIFSAWISELHEITNLIGLPRAHKRVAEFKDFETEIENLELCSAKRMDVSSLILEADENALESYHRIFQRLLQCGDPARTQLLYAIIIASDFSRRNLEALCGVIHGVAALPEDGFSMCQDLFDLQCIDKYLASSRLQIWLRMPCFDATLKQVLAHLANTLGIEPPVEQTDLSSQSMDAVKSYYESRIVEMRAVAQRLEASKKTQKKIDLDGTASMVAELNIEQLKPSADIIADLPDEMVDLVDEAAEDVVELHFPLSSPNLSTMERLVYGLKGSETLIVQLQINPRDEIEGFCVHVTEDDKDSCDEHKFTAVNYISTAPDHLICHGRQNRLTYLISRLIWRQLRAGRSSLKDVYDDIQEALHRGASQCMVCFTTLDISLHRPTLCSSTDCSMTYRRSHLDVRLEDLRTDGRAADLLLSSIYAASTTGTVDLLPTKPPALGTGQEVVKLLNAMPDTATLAMGNYNQNKLDEQTESFFSWLSESFPGFIRQPTPGASASNRGLTNLKSVRNDHTELLLSWLCGSQRGFVVSATDRYRIPIFAGVQQFLVVDAPPEVEAAFAKHNDLMPRNILFHGTSLDRLYSVLCQGLRVLSGTALQKHGAVFGPGIYFAREPSLAMSFSSRTAGETNAAFFDSRSDFKNVTVLLGCEHAGNDDNVVPRAGVHIVTDPSRVMVRYIWIVPHGTQVPRAQDLKIPMLSTFNDLRMTAVTKPR